MPCQFPSRIPRTRAATSGGVLWRIWPTRLGNKYRTTRDVLLEMAREQAAHEIEAGSRPPTHHHAYGLPSIEPCDIVLCACCGERPAQQRQGQCTRHGGKHDRIAAAANL